MTELIRGQLYVAMQRIRGRPLSRYIRELEVAERLPRSEFDSLHGKRLKSILEYAKKHVSLYQTGPWADVPSSGEMRVTDWPVLEKSALRAHYDELLAIPQPTRVDKLRTSGSTGKPVRIVIDRSAAVRGWAHRYRGLQWHGIPIGARALRVTHDRRPLRDFLLGQSCVWPLESPNTIDASIRILRDNRPTMVAGTPSALFYLARHLRERGITAPLAPFARVGGEQLFQFQRQQIESTLCSRAINSYGTTESGAVAGECTAGSLHIYADHVHIEILNGHTPARPGEFGDVVVTSLRNTAMPLVRYRVGDRARLLQERCDCGLPHPVIADLQARTEDIFCGADGHPHHVSEMAEGLGRFFADPASDGVRQIQFGQHDSINWDAQVDACETLRIAIDGEQARKTIEDRLVAVVRKTFGPDCFLKARFVAAIPRKQGKFRYCRATDHSA